MTKIIEDAKVAVLNELKDGFSIRKRIHNVLWDEYLDKHKNFAKNANVFQFDRQYCLRSEAIDKILEKTWKLLKEAELDDL